MKELKIWLAIRSDIDIPIGKAMAQAGHGFTWALRKSQDSDPDITEEYLSTNQPKIVVKAKNEASLLRMEKECQELGLPVALVKDSGRTVFPEPTFTVCAVGPCYEDELPKYVQRMQLL